MRDVHFGSYREDPRRRLPEGDRPRGKRMAFTAIFRGNPGFATRCYVSDRRPSASTGTGTWWDSITCIVIAALATLTALGFLAASIFVARFRYIAPEPELIAYAEGLDTDEARMIADGQADPVDALVTFKRALCRQYAVATDHNRQINQKRALWRSIAGLATLVSILLTLVLVATVTLHYVPRGH